MTPATLSQPELPGPCRACTPEETLRRVEPLLRPMGITRIANITGLDFIGLPVVNVIRPNARSLVASQGKGLTLAAAKASGVMEAIEAHCAEHASPPLQFASAAAMARRHRLPDLDALPRPRRSRFTAETEIPWVEGRDLASGEACWLPFELVHMNTTEDQRPFRGAFLLSSNGLASGNTWEEAVSHALAELIERDASALFAADPERLERRRIALDSVSDAACRDAIARVREAGLALALWDLTSDVGIAAFRCEIMERPGPAAALPQPASGEGCDPNRAVALLRAVTEAAQARLSIIAGVRDDLGPDLYGTIDDADDLAAWWLRLSLDGGPGRYDDVPTQRCTDAAEETAFLLERLSRVGLTKATAIDLTPRDCGAIAVARLVVPGLEPPPEALCRPGRRLVAAGVR